MLKKIEKEKLWVNPDCGLKTKLKRGDLGLEFSKSCQAAKLRNEVLLIAEKTVVFFPSRCFLGGTHRAETIYDTADELSGFKTGFHLVTYGARNGKNNQSTIPIAEHIKKVCEVPNVVHFPCINLTKQDVWKRLKKLKTAGIKNIYQRRASQRGDVSRRENRETSAMLPT